MINESDKKISMKAQPLVSVIMNCFNCERYLKEAIDSVYAQTYTNWEIIFYDNASTDNSASIAKLFDNRLMYFKGNETIPLGAARNIALLKCRGELIAFLDCDDLWKNDKLALQVPYFNDPEVGLVFSNVDINKERESFQILNSKINADPFTIYSFHELFCDYHIAMSSAIISNKILQLYELRFDESLRFSEEFDLFSRIIYLTLFYDSNKKVSGQVDLIFRFYYIDKMILQFNWE